MGASADLYFQTLEKTKDFFFIIKLKFTARKYWPLILLKRNANCDSYIMQA